MIIMGIDPSIIKTGYAIIDNNLKILESGIIKTPTKDNLISRINKLVLNLKEIRNKYNIDYIAIEEAFYNRYNPKTHYIQGKMIGCIMFSFFNDLPIISFTPLQIKSYIGVKNLSKYQKSLKITSKNLVEDTIKYIFNIRNYKFKTDDEADALAIAYSGLQKIVSENLLNIGD